MSKPEAEYVYESVLNNVQVQPMSIKCELSENAEPIPNPYAVGLCKNVDGHLLREPYGEMRKCDLTWSILSTVVDYISDQGENPYKNMDTSHMYYKLKRNCDDFAGRSSDLWDDRFEEVTCNLHYSQRFDDNNDVSTTYLGSYLPGKDGKIKRTFEFDNHTPIDGRGVTSAHLIDETHMKLFFDLGTSRSYLSRKFYDATPILHTLPKFMTTCTGIKIGNGSIVPALFVIPLMFITHGHTFEIYTIVTEIDDGMDLVFGFKNMTETEGMLNTRTGEYDFLGRSIPIFPLNDLDVMPGKKAYVKFRAPFEESLSGRVITKFFGHQKVFTLKVRIENNQGVVEFENRDNEIRKLRRDKEIGLLDLRSIGYFKLNYQRMVHMVEAKDTFKMYHYQQMKSKPKTSLDEYLRLSEHTTRREWNPKRLNRHRAPHEDPYPWLAEDDPRRQQSDAEILFGKIDLKESALSRKEKVRLMKMLIRYRDAFSLRDEIGECPNLEADIKVIDKSPFFVRPFPLAEGDKPFMDQQMERLVSLGIFSKNSTNHTSPVMLITRKLTKDKRPVVDFRLLNTRILRRNTSIPLMSDVLSILGNSECEVVSCVDIKDAYHSIRLTEKSKEYCGILPYFGSPIYRYEVMPMGIACAPQIWMDYITLILSELEEKNKYIAIMDDLLIHSSKSTHWKLLEQLLQSMSKNGLRLSPKKCQLFRTKLTYMGNEFMISKRQMTIIPP